MSEFLKQISALYSTNYSRRTKVCVFCNVEYCDVTKRNLGKTCSEKCAYNMMVLTRHENGSYVRTEKQNQLTRESIQKTFEERNIREKISQKVCAAVENGLAERISRGLKERNKKFRHWTQTEEDKKRLSEKNKGRIFSEKAKHNMSLGQQRRLRSDRENRYTSAIGGVRADLGHYFRSCWESNFARVQNFLGKKWEYEPVSFQLTEEKSYTPDFRIDGTFYELKGRMLPTDEEKIRLFREKFPLETLVIIGPEEYKQLKLEFENIVAWEGR